MPHSPLTLVKVGGSLCGVPGSLPRVGLAIAGAAAAARLVVVPGGGPFADAVRRFAQSHPLSDSAAHWMAILGMDQYAFALAEQIPGGRLVEDLAGIREAHAARQVPVLAPAHWLRAADELPHSWEITSDSLAAYLATLIGAEQLVLIKPVGGGAELMDRRFLDTLPAGVRWQVLGVDQVERLAEMVG